MLEERLNKQDYHLRTNRTQLANLATCSIGDATTHFLASVARVKQASDNISK